MDQLGLFIFACPRCCGELTAHTATEFYCPSDDVHFTCSNGIWRFALPETLSRVQQFIQQYETVRSAEGRGSTDPQYYQSLPFRDIHGNLSKDWAIRARSYQAFVGRWLEPMERSSGGRLKILDLGAGNGWLSNLLALRGHEVAAIDLTINDFDGLGTRKYYQSSFTSVQADFDHLPFLADQVDLAVFNASFHYSVGYQDTLQEVLRVLRQDGHVAIMDSPVYHDFNSGALMVKERQSQLARRYGFPSNALPSENYLTFSRIAQLGDEMDLHWRMIFPGYGLRWRLKPLISRLRNSREPASFLLLIGSRQTDRLFQH